MLKSKEMRNFKPGDIVSNKQRTNKELVLVLNKPIPVKDSLKETIGHYVKVMWLGKIGWGQVYTVSSVPDRANSSWVHHC